MVISVGKYGHRQTVPYIQGTIARRRLLDKLHSGMGYRFQVIKAPPGYGKTTLLSDFARELEAPVCWYSLSEADRDPASLYQGLSQSVSNTFPGHFSQNTNIPTSCGVTLSATLSKMLSQIPDYFILIMEDLHTISQTHAAEIIDNLITRWPDNGHLVISTRSLDSFAHINDSLARQQAACLSVDDLCFTPGEVKQLAHESHTINLADNDALELTEKMNGWPLGICLALNSPDDFKTITTTSRNQLFDFMARQVLDQQPFAKRKLLLELSTFTVIEPEFCAEVLGSGNIRKRLHQLIEANLFINETGSDSYKYHQLFREFLQTSLKKDNPDLFYALHAKAAKKYETLGCYEPAIEHYLTGRNYRAAAGLIRQGGEKLLRQGHCFNLARWLEQIPDALRLSMVDLEILRAQCLVNTGEPGQAGHIITNILLDNARSLENTIRARALYTRSSACRLLGQQSQSLLDAEIAAKILKGDGSHKGLLGDIYTRIGHLYFDKGKFTQSLEYLQKAHGLFSDVFDLDNLACVNNTIGGIYKNLGDLLQASVYYEYARQGFVKNGNRGNLSMALVNIAYVQHKHGVQTLALQTLKEAQENARAAGFQRIEVIIALAYGEIYRDVEKFDESLKTFEEAIDLARQCQESKMISYAKAGLGETYRVMDDINQAVFWTREALVQAQVEQQPYETTLFEIQYAMILDSQGKRVEATAMLDEVYKKLLLIGDSDALARTCFASAVTSFNQKNYDAACKWLGRMLTYIDTLGYDDFVVIEGSRHPLLVQYAATKEIGGQFFVKLAERIKEKRDRLQSEYTHPPGESNLTWLEIYAFGEMRVILNKQQVGENVWRSNRAKELFFFLLSNAGKTAEEIATELWPEFPPAKSTSNFHINLFRARRATSPGIIVQENGRYFIHPEIDFRYDVLEFEQRCRDISKLSLEKRIKEAEEIIDLYRGNFMPNFDSEWVTAKRCELENKYLKLLFEMVGYYAKKDNLKKVVNIVERVLDVNQDDDEVYYQGIQAYLKLGEQLSAYHLYKRYLSNLKELGIEPEPKIVNLVGNMSLN